VGRSCRARPSSRPKGAPRVHAELALAHGVRIARKRVERLMRQAGLSGLVPKRRGRTTIRVPGVRVADDLVGRQFRPAAPNVLWLADITYLRTWEGWLYLAAVQDAVSRRIVGWSTADHMRSELVVDALNMAVARRRPDAGLFHRRSWPTREELRCEVFDCIGIFYNAGSGAFVVRGPDAWLPVSGTSARVQDTSTDPGERCRMDFRLRPHPRRAVLPATTHGRCSARPPRSPR
jgi:transposase InsO family protein